MTRSRSTDFYSDSRISGSIDFAAFTEADPLHQRLVWQRHGTAKNNHEDVETRFLNLWLGFNEWGMRVTHAQDDAGMIRALGDSSDLKAAFERLLTENTTFKNDVQTFAGFWPIFNVKYLTTRRLRYVFHELERREYVKKLLALSVKHAPRDGYDRNKPTWGATIQAIYMVRCNFFHGGKGDSADDAGIIAAAINTLLGFIEGAGLYKWKK